MSDCAEQTACTTVFPTNLTRVSGRKRDMQEQSEINML